jgi:hypothetical protein
MTQNTTTDTLLSGKDATTVLAAHGLRTWEAADVDLLNTDNAGGLLVDMMFRAVMKLEEAVGSAARASVRLTQKTKEVQDAITDAMHVDVSWVEQATRDVVTAVRARDAAVRDYQSAERVAREHLGGLRTQD